MRLKREASYLAQAAMIPSFDIQPVGSVLANAVANVTEKIEVLKSCLADLFIGEFMQVLKRGIGTNKRAHLPMQTAFRLMPGHEL